MTTLFFSIRTSALVSLFLFSTHFISAQNPSFANVVLRSQYTFTGQSGANIFGYAQNGREYALVGIQQGTGIVDITDPTAPTLIKQVNAANSPWREIKMYRNYAYITTEATGQGLQIVNLANLPSNTLPEKNFFSEGNLVNIINIHSLHIDTAKGFLYAFGGNSTVNVSGTNVTVSGCIVLDIKTDPWNPRYVGKLTSPYIHDGFAINDTLYAAHIYGGYVRTYDFRDKANPSQIGSNINTPTAFPHNVWRSDDHKTLLTTDENSDSYLAAYDISNHLSIQFLDKIRSVSNGNAYIHNTHIKGNYAVTSWYSEGITIVDITRPQNLVQVGQYDMYNGSGNGFIGCWGVYPFLPSGNLIASTLTGELYVLTPTYVRACYLEGNVTDASNGNILSGVLVKINSTDADKKATTAATGNYGTGQATAGIFTVTFSKAGYETKTITGVSLSNGNVTTLNVQLNPIPVPIELVDFQGFRDNQTIDLMWRTAEESDIKNYEIERSKNASNWEVMQAVAAKNKPTTYFQMDEKPLLGTNYYRLKINHLGGQFEYSKVISVQFDDPSVKQARVFPNPTKDKIYLWENSFSPKTKVFISDVKGQIVRQTTVEECTKGLIVSDLPRGTYLLIVVNGKVPFQQKFVLAE